jgi:type II secretory pathway component PulJ
VLLWGTATIGLLLALAAFVAVRRVSRRLDALTQSYWELRYDYTRLRAHVERLGPERDETEAPPPPPAQSSVTFVPLSTIRKRDG